jgi:hypothetical protein
MGVGGDLVERSVLGRPNSGLGGYAQSVETSPVATLTFTGAMVGALWGTLLGWGAAKVTRSPSSYPWIAAGALAGGVILASEGYRQGLELQEWLRQYPGT